MLGASLIGAPFLIAGMTVLPAISSPISQEKLPELVQKSETGRGMRLAVVDAAFPDCAVYEHEFLEFGWGTQYDEELESWYFWYEVKGKSTVSVELTLTNLVIDDGGGFDLLVHDLDELAGASRVKSLTWLPTLEEKKVYRFVIGGIVTANAMRTIYVCSQEFKF